MRSVSDARALYWTSTRYVYVNMNRFYYLPTIAVASPLPFIGMIDQRQIDRFFYTTAGSRHQRPNIKGNCCLIFTLGSVWSVVIMF